MQSEIEFDEDKPRTRTDEVVNWLTRSYKSNEDWKQRALDVFYACNGDSNLSRIRFAVKIRSEFLNNPPEAEEVSTWSKGFEQVETKHVSPPKVTSEFASFVNWAFVADYFLFIGASCAESLGQENQVRADEYSLVKKMSSTQAAIRKARQVFRDSPSLAVTTVHAEVKKEFDDTTVASIKEARRLENINATDVMPEPIDPPPKLTRYTSAYFNSSVGPQTDY